MLPGDFQNPVPWICKKYFHDILITFTTIFHHVNLHTSASVQVLKPSAYDPVIKVLPCLFQLQTFVLYVKHFGVSETQ